MGTVYLVGAGPGDAGLLTRRAARLLRRADVVLHDALVSPEILALIGPRARRIDVGKRCGGPRTDQSEICRILLVEAATNRIVVRLKGGDPFVFGRGGEEAEALAEAGVPFRIVPGITSGLAAAAYAGIAATHRGLASSVTLITGQDAEGAAGAPARWRALAGVGGTIIVYMAQHGIERIAEELVRGGLHDETPAVAVEWATTRQQRVVESTLGGIARALRSEQADGPVVVIIGSTAALRGQLQWLAGQQPV